MRGNLTRLGRVPPRGVSKGKPDPATISAKYIVRGKLLLLLFFRIAAIRIFTDPAEYQILTPGVRRAINSVARVPPLQGGGRGFKSLIAHQFSRGGSKGKPDPAAILQQPYSKGNPDTCTINQS